MNPCLIKCAIIVSIMATVFIPFGEAGAQEWTFYAASNTGKDPGPALRDWYILNRIEPVPPDAAEVFHYFDRESIAGNIGFEGGIFRVWEKYVLQRETKGYVEARLEVEKEEEKRWGMKPKAIDYGLLFPLIVNRATKEIHTLYEINCESREFIILEVNHYDKDGIRMTRDTNMDTTLWYPIESGTVMETFFLHICKSGTYAASHKAL